MYKGARHKIQIISGIRQKDVICVKSKTTADFLCALKTWKSTNWLLKHLIVNLSSETVKNNFSLKHSKSKKP